MLGTLDCHKSFSLQAFHSLLSRRARRLSKYLSRRHSNECLPSRQCQLYIMDMNNECISTIPSIDILPSVYDDDYRSILAASDCSDDDLRDDEGLINISFSHFPDIAPFSPKLRRERDSVSSKSSSSLSLSAGSAREEWTPLSSPALSTFAECVSSEHSDSSKPEAWKDDADLTIEDTLKWILEYM